MHCYITLALGFHYPLGRIASLPCQTYFALKYRDSILDLPLASLLAFPPAARYNNNKCILYIVEALGNYCICIDIERFIFTCTVG